MSLNFKKNYMTSDDEYLLKKFDNIIKEYCEQDY